MAADKSLLRAGVDIGGSNVKVALVDAQGRTAGKVFQRPILSVERDADAVVSLACALLHEALNDAAIALGHVEAVGVGCPGVLHAGGVIHAASNFPSWHDVPLRQMLVDRLGDGVKWVGMAQGDVKNFIMLSKEKKQCDIPLGTGVGVGIVTDGKLVRGGFNMIEGGHMIVERNGRLCGCSQRGCLEAYSSAGALVLEAQEHVAAGADSTLATYPSEIINAELIFQLAKEGDAMCTRLIAEAADYLGFACVNFCRMLDPEMIVLSGGMAEAGDVFISQVRDAYLKYSWTAFPNPVRIEKASAGYHSGVIGAAYSCLLQLNSA
uniref:Glucokinase n=1 Tax=Globisporangium ultimum (strain ATCC 200006 / CBS 805.95 / DAOM BR144) TaxID=431595 RepID=K3W791_GLOUD